MHKLFLKQHRERRISSSEQSDIRSAESATIARVRAGDMRAYRELYQRHGRRVYALCLRMTADRAWAEELTQDVFVRAWERLDGFRGEAAFGTWLHRLSVNLVLTAMRGERRRQHNTAAAAEAMSPGTSYGEKDVAVALDLERAIAALPERARMVFVLYDIEGFTHAEIASMLGLAVGTSKGQLHRARVLLREVLQ